MNSLKIIAKGEIRFLAELLLYVSISLGVIPGPAPSIRFGKEIRPLKRKNLNLINKQKLLNIALKPNLFEVYLKISSDVYPY